MFWASEKNDRFRSLGLQVRVQHCGGRGEGVPVERPLRCSRRSFFSLAPDGSSGWFEKCWAFGGNCPPQRGVGGANACFVMGRELRRRHRTAMRAQLALAGLTASACPPTDTPLDCQRVSTNRHALSRILIPAHHLHREVQTHLDQHDGFHWLRHSPSPVAISTTAAICWPGPLNDALARVLVLRWRPI